MSDDEDISDVNVLSDSLQKIHHHVEQLAHVSKHMYSKALRIYQQVENPELDFWTEPFKLHERAHKWAKHNMVASKCSLWEVHDTLLKCAKRDNRVFRGHTLRLLDDEATILDLPANHPVSVWMVLGRLPRFFL
jgi:hypothetical protein